MPKQGAGRIRIDRQGRAVIPAALRRSLDLEPGDTLAARVENGQLVLEKPDHVLARLQAEFAAAVPAGVSLVDELIAERRAEAAREEAKT